MHCTQKNVLITGATAGIGLKLAEELVAYNVNLLLIGRREEKLRGLQSKLQTLTKNTLRFFLPQNYIWLQLLLDCNLMFSLNKTHFIRA